jgi:hypothetical protein
MSEHVRSIASFLDLFHPVMATAGERPDGKPLVRHVTTGSAYIDSRKHAEAVEALYHLAAPAASTPDPTDAIDGPLFLYRTVKGEWLARTGWGYWAERAGKAHEGRGATMDAALAALAAASDPKAEENQGGER